MEWGIALLIFVVYFVFKQRFNSQNKASFFRHYSIMKEIVTCIFIFLSYWKESFFCDNLQKIYAFEFNDLGKQTELIYFARLSLAGVRNGRMLFDLDSSHEIFKSFEIIILDHLNELLFIF